MSSVEPGSKDARTARPNVLMIVTDQHNREHLGHRGRYPVRTPHIDALASRGTVFDRMYVASPTCAPNRASLFTGRYPSSHGLTVNGLALDPDVETLPAAMARNGYRTALVGKSHLQPFGIGRGGDDQARPEGADPAQYAWDEWENEARHDEGFVEFPPQYYGFESVDLVTGHSDMAGGHYVQWLRERGIAPASVRGPRNALHASEHWEQVYRTAMPEEAYPTRYVADKACERIRSYAEQDDPFFVVMSFPDPHHPFTPPGKYWGRHDPESLDLPETFAAEHVNPPPHIAEMLQARGQTDTPYNPWGIAAEQLREALAAAFGMVEMIDDAIGEVLRTLREIGLEDDTIIVFTSDHGDMFGEHGLSLKHAVHYRGVVNVPLIMAGPGIAVGRAAGLVSTVDLAPTILKLTSTPQYEGLQGRSIAESLRGGHPTGRHATLIEEDEVIDVRGYAGPKRIRTIVDAQGRFTYYQGAEFGELYDHRSDPDELVNLYGDPDARDLRIQYLASLVDGLIDKDGVIARPRFLG